MNSAISLEIIHNITLKAMGPIEAKNAATDALYLAIERIRDDGLPVTAEELDKRLGKFADDFIEATKNQVA